MVRALYLVLSGAPAPERTPELVRLLQVYGHEAVCLPTPMGVRFHDTAELERLTGEPVRVGYRMPGTGSSCHRRTGGNCREDWSIRTRNLSAPLFGKRWRRPGTESARWRPLPMGARF